MWVLWVAILVDVPFNDVGKQPCQREPFVVYTDDSSLLCGACSDDVANCAQNLFAGNHLGILGYRKQLFDEPSDMF